MNGAGGALHRSRLAHTISYNSHKTIIIIIVIIVILYYDGIERERERETSQGQARPALYERANGRTGQTVGRQKKKEKRKSFYSSFLLLLLLLLRVCANFKKKKKMKQKIKRCRVIDRWACVYAPTHPCSTYPVQLCSAVQS